MHRSWYHGRLRGYGFQTNRVFESDEFNFFKERRDKGVRDAAHEKHKFFEKLGK